MNSRRLGGSYIYTCPIGFYFWTSSFYAGQRFAGACISCAMPSVGRQSIINRIYGISKGEIPKAEISEYLDDVPVKSGEDVEELAKMMLLCTKYLSFSGSGQNEKTEGESGNYLPGNFTDGGSMPVEMLSGYMDQERLMLASLRCGDCAEAVKTAQNLVRGMDAAYGGKTELYKYKIIELTVMLSRSGANPENTGELIEINGRYLKRIEESVSADEITEHLCAAIERMAGKIFSFQGIRHASALRRAERYIRENYTRKISLKEIAGISGLSAPYFSTIFKDEMGENLSNYLNRLRVEKASAMLRETENPINGISQACGFEDQSWFSKIFKTYTGTSPCRYREHGGLEHGRG